MLRSEVYDSRVDWSYGEEDREFFAEVFRYFYKQDLSLECRHCLLWDVCPRAAGLYTGGPPDEPQLGEESGESFPEHLLVRGPY